MWGNTVVILYIYTILYTMLFTILYTLLYTILYYTLYYTLLYTILYCRILYYTTIGCMYHFREPKKTHHPKWIQYDPIKHARPKQSHKQKNTCNLGFDSTSGLHVQDCKSKHVNNSTICTNYSDYLSVLIIVTICTICQ